MASDGILTYLHALLLLVIVQKLWHNLRADLSHSKIFGVNLVAVNAQLNCHQSNSQPMIANTFLTRSTLTSVLLIEGLPLLVSSSMSSLREPLWTTCTTCTTCTTRTLGSSISPNLRILAGIVRGIRMEFFQAGPETSCWFVSRNRRYILPAYYVTRWSLPPLIGQTAH